MAPTNNPRSNRDRQIIAFIGSGAVIVAAIITGILGPIINSTYFNKPSSASSASATPSLAQIPNPYSPYLGTLALSSSLNSTTPNPNWEVSPLNSTDQGTCKFT